MRRVKLETQFWNDASELGVRRTVDGVKLGRAVRALERAAQLPDPARDKRTFYYDESTEHWVEFFVRRVPGANLWIWYRATDGLATLYRLRNEPPPHKGAPPDPSGESA